MAENGSKRKVYVVTTGTPDVNTAIGGEMSNSVTINNTIIDISDKDSAWAENISGQKSWSVSASFNIVKGATGEQKKIFDKLVSGEKVKIFIGELDGTTQEDGWVGEALIESMSESNEKDASVTREVSFTGTGALTQINAS